MKKTIKMLLVVMVLVSIIAMPVSAATTEKSYYAIGDWGGYTNPDENFVMTDLGNDIYTVTANIPASTSDTPHAYKITNGTWDADGCWGLETYTHPNNPYPTQPMGSIQFDLAQAADVTFYFNVATNAVADSTYFTLMTPYIVGDFFDEAGIGTDWTAEQATMLLMDKEWNGIYEGTFTIPAGDYTYKITNGKSWDECYGKDGATTGMDNAMALSYTKATDVTFSFNSITKVTTITKEAASTTETVDTTVDTTADTTAETTADTTAMPKTADSTVATSVGLGTVALALFALTAFLKKKERDMAK